MRQFAMLECAADGTRDGDAGDGGVLDTFSGMSGYRLAASCTRRTIGRPFQRARPPMNVSKRQIGLGIATTLVLGNMIGSGVFLLPASLAPYGGYSLAGWLISAAGALLLAGVFFRLSKRAPRAGGPYAYSRDAFGDCVGFLVAWVYWIALVGGNATIAVAFASYMSAFVPALATRPLYGALTAMTAVWILVAVNIAGIRSAGGVQVATTVLKILPLLALAVFGFTRFDPHLLVPGPQAGSPLGAINISVAATLFAFVGVECATIPAGHVRDPEKPFRAPRCSAPRSRRRSTSHAPPW
jgi:APA family basic amino acid/polyamine antiporter